MLSVYAIPGVRRLELEELVAKAFNTTISELAKPDRRSNRVIRKTALIFFLKKYLNYKTYHIAGVLKKHHQTIYHAYDNAEQYIATQNTMFLSYLKRLISTYYPFNFSDQLILNQA